MELRINCVRINRARPVYDNFWRETQTSGCKQIDNDLWGRDYKTSVDLTYRHWSETQTPARNSYSNWAGQNTRINGNGFDQVRWKSIWSIRWINYEIHESMEIDLTDSIRWKSIWPIRWKSIWPIRWINYQTDKMFLNDFCCISICTVKNCGTF